MMMNKLMKEREFIRNVSIIAHVDHGKTALTESLTHVHMDVGEEAERGITIKAASVSLHLSRMENSSNNKHEEKEKEKEKEKETNCIEQEYLINLIDSPGHVDFSSEVTAALRITDGAICVVDCIEGVCVQTETVLRQSILERVKPVLFINKMDRLWLEKQLSLPECFDLFRRTIESTNVICTTYNKEMAGDIDLNPQKLNVGFGSGYFGWGFTLGNFADMYCSKFGLSKTKLIKKLWGNHYYDTMEKKWKNSSPAASHPKLNGFCEYVLKPIQVLHDSIMKEEKDTYLPIIYALELNIKRKELDECNKPKDVLKLVMSRWLPAKNCILDLCADCLPSPVEAQRYRIPNLYTGPLDTPEAQSMLSCDPNGKLSMYVSKMIPIKADPGRFIAFGRVFSGTISRGQELRILGQDSSMNNRRANDNDNNDGDEEKLQERSVLKKKVQGIIMMMGSKQEKLNECPAGNVCGIMGIDNYLTKSGTLCNSEEIFPFKTMKFSVSPIVKVAVNVFDTKHLKKLIEGLTRLSKYDPLIEITMNKQGQHIVAGSGELHLETCLNTLRDEFMNNAPIKISNPIVSFCEGINGTSGCSTLSTNSNVFMNNSSKQKQSMTMSNSNWTCPAVMCSKSANKHNRVYVSTEPMNDDLCNAIENDTIKLCGDMKQFGRSFVNKFVSWNKIDAQNIWSFGCAPYGKPNILVDQTKGIDLLDKIKPSIIEGFTQYTSGGILCDEPLRGIRYNLTSQTGTSWKIHSDPSHRGPGQIVPTVKNCLAAGQLASDPILYEPMYVAEIEVPIESQSSVFNVINKVRGEFIKITDKTDIGIPLCRICAYIPILETIKDEEENKKGFTQMLIEETKGKAFPIMKFSHWQKVDTFMSNKLVMHIRKRKGMPLEFPYFYDYYDKL